MCHERTFSCSWNARRQTASCWLARNHRLGSPLPSRERADAQHPGEGAFADSPRDLPSRDDFARFRVFGIFQGDAHRRQFISDAVGLVPVLGFARGEACGD